MEGRDGASLFLLPEEFPVGPNGVHADADGDGTEPQSVHVHLLRNFCCPTLWELLSISFLQLPVKEGTLRAAGIAEGSGVDSVQGKGRLWFERLQCELDPLTHVAYCCISHLDFPQSTQAKASENTLISKTLLLTSAPLKNALGSNQWLLEALDPQRAAPGRDSLLCPSRSPRHGLNY